MRDILHFLRLSRPLNVVLTMLVFALACYVAMGHHFAFLKHGLFWHVCFTTALLSATGYWINDVYDYRIDLVNKPARVIVSKHLSVKKVLTAYFALLAVMAAWSLLFLPWGLMALNLGVAASLFVYARWLKRTAVWGNLLIAVLAAAVVYYAAFLYRFTPALWWMMMFAFEITFLREVAKDMEDLKGDLRHHLQTLPIRLGMRTAKWTLAFSYIIFVLSCWLPFLFEWWWYGQPNLWYALASMCLVQFPIVLLLSRLRGAIRPAHFKGQSLWLKLVILPGLLTVLLLH